jgi:hypothetical protein
VNLFMTHSVRVADFRPSVHGFPFPNSYPKDRKFFLFDTPFGPLGMADASRGLCGGMIFTVMDLFHHGVRAVPASPTDPVFRYFCRRLFSSWGVPFAWLKYWSWQLRPGASKTVAGVRVRDGVTRLTVLEEWPKIRAALDRGQLAPLGLVKQAGFSPAKLGMNHQVLAYGYDLDEADNRATIHIYDPNYPGDDTCALTVRLTDPDANRAVVHSCEGPSVRGVFFTEYRPTAEPPPFCREP